MLSVAEAKAKARSRLRSSLVAWAARPAEAGGLDLALHPPTEEQVLADQRAAAEWAASWRTISESATPKRPSEADDAAPPALTVDWTERSWARVGRQRIPVRLRLGGPDAVADFVGGEDARGWRRMAGRAAVLRERFGDTEAIASAIRAQGKRILALDDDAFTTLVDVTSWLQDNPVRALRPRQLPIRGVDSKWFEAHRRLVTALLSASGHPDAVDVLDAPPRVRLRVLDPGLAPAGLSDLAAPVTEVAELDLAPRLVFVFENLESVLAMPQWPGAVAVHGAGYAVDAVARIGWVRQSPVIYWGDLDTHGFAILARLRSHLPGVASALMDEATLFGHRDLWVSEPTPHTGTLAGLNEAEERALARIRAEGDVRLEQERIPWATALAALQSAASAATAP